MSTDSKYEKALLDNASNLDAITRSNGEVYHCAKRVINHSDTKDLLNIISFITKAGNNKDIRVRNIAVSLKDSLFLLYGIRRIEELCKTHEEKNSIESEKTLEELLDELNRLIGLETVKSKINDLIAFQRIQQLRKRQGLAASSNTLHLAFTGNPGTGKTTVARIVGRIYKQIGLLSKGHFMEVSRTDLIAGYQGQTALKVKSVIDKARGGVLFIDEAYSITENDHSDSYGRECLTELTKALEDYRNDLVVIVAGYTEPMKVFFESNPGLKSRFNTFIEFEDYNATELFEILQLMCNEGDYVLSETAANKLKQIFEYSVKNKKENFANGRFVRNMYENTIMNQARRLLMVENPSVLELKEIIDNDINEIDNQLPK